MFGECLVVHLQPREFIDSHSKWHRLDNGEWGNDLGGQWQLNAHLFHRAPEMESHFPSDLDMGRSWLEHPPMHMAAAFGVDERHGFIQHLRSDDRHFISVMRVDDEIDQPRVIAAGNLAIRHHVVVTRLPRHQAGETRSAPLA